MLVAVKKSGMDLMIVKNAENLKEKSLKFECFVIRNLNFRMKSDIIAIYLVVFLLIKVKNVKGGS